MKNNQESKKDFIIRHLYSFGKTYITVFLALYLRDIAGGNQEGENIILWNLAVIIPSLKWAFLSALRNGYKVLVE